MNARSLDAPADTLIDPAAGEASVDERKQSTAEVQRGSAPSAFVAVEAVPISTPPVTLTIVPALQAEITDTCFGWQIVIAKSRVDFFTQEETISELRARVQNGHKRIAFDLQNTRFVSLPVLKVCVEIAQAFSETGGNFVLIACPEKIKRHFEIYGTLKHIQLLRSQRELWD